MTMKAPKQSKPAADGHKSQTRQPFLQRKPGAAGRPFIASPTAPQIQPKLTVNQPGDRYEQEADLMAERVMRMPSENVAPPMISRMRAGGPVQRKCAACEAGGTTCSSCAAKEKEKAIQRQSTSSEPTHAPDTLAQRLQARSGQGALLSPAMHQQMGGAFGQDFSSVRLHTDDEAIAMSRELNAQAFTHGQDIYFDSGKYQPETDDGKRLLGHELTHTVQQGGSMIQKTGSDTSVASDVVPQENLEAPDYNNYSDWEIIEAYGNYNATPAPEDIDYDTFTAIETVLTNRVYEAVAQCENGKCGPGSNLTIPELYRIYNIIQVLRERPEIRYGLMIDIGYMKLFKYSMEIDLTITLKSREHFKPANWNTSRDFSDMSFIEVFYDLEEADNWLQNYAFKEDIPEGKIYVQNLREQLRTKVALNLPLELFSEYINVSDVFVTGLSKEESLEYIYTIENLLYTIGALEDFTNEHSHIALPKPLFNASRQEQFEYRLSNNLAVLKVHLNNNYYISDYRTITEGGLTKVPENGVDFATDPVGIRNQLTQIWIDSNYYPSSTGSNLIKIALGPVGLGALDMSQIKGDTKITYLIYRIAKGDCPPGVEPGWLVNQIAFQWKQIKSEAEAILDSFPDVVIAQTVAALDASEKKIRDSAKVLNIEIDDAQISNYFLSMHEYGLAGDVTEIESTGIAEAANALGKLKQEIEEIDISMLQKKMDIYGEMRDTAVTGAFDLLDHFDASAPDDIKASWELHLIKKQERIAQIGVNREKKAMEYDMLRKDSEARYPMLASWTSRGDSDDLYELGEGGHATKLMLVSDIYSKLRSIREIKSKLGDDISVWELHEIIPAAKNIKMILPLSFEDYVIDSKIKQEREDKEFWETFTTIVAIGLTLASFGSLSGLTGGALLAVRVGSVALDAYDLYNTVKEYDIKSDMSNTDIDLALSLSNEEPSLFSLAMSIIGLVGIKGDIEDIFKSASKLLKSGPDLVHYMDEVKIIARGIKDEAAEAKFIEMMEIRYKVNQTTKSIEDTVQKTLESGTKTIETVSGKLHITKYGFIYKCNSPCEQLRSFYSTEILADAKLGEKLEDIEARLKSIGGDIDSDAALKAELEDLQKTLDRQWNLNNWDNPLISFDTFKKQYKEFVPDGKIPEPELQYYFDNGFRINPQTKRMKLPDSLKPPKKVDFLSQSPEELKELAKVGEGATSLAEWYDKLKRGIPGLSGLSDEALDRILKFAPNVDHIKGQLLEEIMGNIIRGKLEPGVEFIPGHLIRDAAGKQLTDGLLIKRVEEKIEIVGIVEAKAGKASSKGLNVSYTSYSDLPEYDLIQLRNYALDEFKEKNGIVGIHHKEIMKKNKEEIEAIMRDIHTKDMGQIEKDFERLMPFEGKDSVGIFIDGIDGELTEVIASTRSTKIITGTPNDVVFEISEDIARRGISVESLQGIDLSSEQLETIATQLGAEQIVNGSKL